MADNCEHPYLDKEKPKPGQIRKDIYAYIATVIGRDLTEPEHKALKAQIMEHSRLLQPLTSPTKIKRIWTCRSCKKEDTLSKLGDKKRRKFNKGDVETLPNESPLP